MKLFQNLIQNFKVLDTTKIGQMQHMKITVVGDGGVGKTSLLVTITTNAFPSDYIPTRFDNHVDSLLIDGRPIGFGMIHYNRM